MAQAERIHYIDWLRVIIVFGIALFHIFLIFSGVSWLVRNRQSSIVLAAFDGFCFTWGIPAMFFIAGADSWFALKRRSWQSYLRDRTIRLLIPCVVGIAVLSPLQQYLAASNPPPPLAQLPKAYVRFFASLRFEQPFAFFSSYGYHLWFLGYLFIISAVCLPALHVVKTARCQAWIHGFERFCRARGGILLAALPLVVAEILLRPRFPAYESWADIATYTWVFLLGAVILSDRVFNDVIRRDIVAILPVAVLSIVGVGIVQGLHATYTVGAPLALQAGYSALWACTTWSWLLIVLYCGIRWLDRTWKLVDLANEDVLPFYVLHHPVVVAVASFIVPLALSLWIKVGILIVTVYPVTIVACELLVRRIPLMRRAIGLPTPAAAGADVVP